MRNASKNTIKQVMRKAKFDQEKYDMYFHPSLENIWGNADGHKSYFLYNDVGAQIYIMSKGNICNRSLKGLIKYNKTLIT